MFKAFFNRSAFKVGLIFLSRVISTLLGVVLLPVYIRFLGAESYGLVAFYTTLTSALLLLDMGLSASANREIAIMDAKNVSAIRKGSLVYSIELVNWSIAIVAGIALVLLSSYIAQSWINVKDLGLGQVKNCVILMAFIFIFQFPTSVYDGVINGMQRQGQNAIINLVGSILKNVGGVLVIAYISSDIQVYFIWQLIVQVALTFALRIYSYRIINLKGGSKFFSIAILRKIKSFAVGMTGTSIIAFCILQVDKIVVSKFLYLEYVGYYNIAFLVAGTLSLIALPVVNVVLPAFNRFQAKHMFKEFDDLYYRSCKWLIITLAPIACVIIVFAHDILQLWTQNEKLVRETTPILQVVTIGSFINSITSMFYFYTLGKGNVRYGLLQNTIAAIIIVPSVIIATKLYGAFGAGCCWLLYNVLVFTISLPIFHRLYLKGQLGYWFKTIFYLPVLLSASIFFAVKYANRYFLSGNNFLVIFLLIAMGCCFYILILRDTRTILYGVLKGKITFFK
ncbi:MAG: oligosaccharide flippase family protein [Niabella sp.]|nr:oligosaccharide flippase family protein [Niabella sp.]